MGLTIIISVDRAASSGTSTTDVEISDLKVNIKILQAVNIFKKNGFRTGFWIVRDIS